MDHGEDSAHDRARRGDRSSAQDRSEPRLLVPARLGKSTWPDNAGIDRAGLHRLGHWNDCERYFGTDEPGNVTDLHFPGFSKEMAEFLVKQRRVKAVGIDTPSIDHGPSKDFPVHQVFGAANVPIFENVAELDRVPAKGATIFSLPMKIKGGSGAPLRIFGLLP